MAYTPFESEQQIVDLYSLEHVSLRHRLHAQLLPYASRFHRAAPEEFDRVALIA